MNLGRRKTGSEHVSHIKRFLNHTNDPLRRLKALRTGLDKVSIVDAKQILTDYSAPAFHVFYMSFSSMENAIKERASRGRAISDQLREIMEVILPSLERLLTLLPELVQNKWQYNSICLVVRKLLHPENTFELRQFGIKLLVLWLQALQDNAGDACIELFAAAIPHFPPKKTPLGLPDETSLTTATPSSHSLCERYGPYSTRDSTPESGAGHHEWVSTQPIAPLHSVTPNATDPTLQLMEYLLTSLTHEVCRLKWTDPSQHLKGFSFLFFQFKIFYLVCLYKNFRSDAGLYSPPPPIKLPSQQGLATPLDPPTNAHRSTREGVWQKHPSSKHVVSVSAVIKLDYDTSQPVYQTIRHLILKFVLKWIMPGFHSNRPGSIQPKLASPSPSLLPGEQSFTPDSTELMRDMWFASRDNVNLLFEICHQAFKLPLSHPGVVNKLTELYLSWVQDTSKPLFMQSPSLATTSLPSELIGAASSLAVIPWEAINGYSNFDSSDVRAGLQPALKMFISHTSQLFHHEAKDEGPMLDNQIESGRRILRLYQEIAQQWILDGEGWLFLLTVLLHLTKSLLREVSEESTSLGSNLADMLLQTLLLSYVRASMIMNIPNDFWNELQYILSSLTQWKQVIVQWTDIMRNVTHCLARVVYQVDVDDLPLQHLQENTRHRSRTQTIASEQEWKRKKSFTNIHPPLTSHHKGHSTSSVPSAVHRSGLLKVHTFDVGPRNSPINDIRRSSSPGPHVTTTSSPVSLHANFIIKDDISSQGEDIVIANPILTPESRELPTPKGDTLVIENQSAETTPTKDSNDDTHSSDLEHQSSDPDISLNDSTPLCTQPIRRSMSENLELHRLSHQEAFDEKSSNTPEPSIDLFSRYIPHESHTPPSKFSPKSEDLTVIICDEDDVKRHSPNPQVITDEPRWLPMNVSLVWQRMLSILGDINKIESPDNHALAMKCVSEIWMLLQEIECNLGVSLDNAATPPLPQYMPPVQLFLPWTVKACSLSHEYQEGRKLAYQLLCGMVLRHVSCSAPSLTFMPHFYRLIHCGLQPISDAIYVTVKAGCCLLSYGLPGSSILLHDCLVGCSHLLNSKSTEVPRTDTLTLLGSMYFLLHQYGNTPLPVPVSGGDTVLADHLKERVMGSVFDAAVKEPQRSSRCLALYQVGICIYSELINNKPSKNITEGLDILLASLKIADITVVMSALDMLTLISECSDNLLSYCTSYPCRLLQGLTSASAALLLTDDVEKKSKVVISVLLCLRDWLMSLPIKDMINEDKLTDTTLLNIFKVLHVASTIHEETVPYDLTEVPSPIEITLAPLERSPPRTNKAMRSSSRRQNVTGSQEGLEQIVIAAQSVISHLMNLLTHFPFLGGAAQQSCNVCVYHDCPSLQYLDELSPEIFDSPRVQFFTVNGNAVLSVVEIPTESTGLPYNCTTANYQCRFILRDITGKYCWDAGILYGTKDSITTEDTFPVSLMKAAESMESLLSTAEDSERSSSSLPLEDLVIDPLVPPCWQSVPHNSSDLLNDLLVHIENTSPECILCSGIGLAEPSPSINEPTQVVENCLESLIKQQHHSEHEYHLDTDSLLCMQCDPITEPDHWPSTFAFHHCRLFLSHLGFLSWQKRNTLNLLEKNEQLIRELKNLDSIQTQCRQTYKVAVLYVACGQEDKTSILNNTKASRQFEEFVAGLGWEVDMETHTGYTGGLKTTYCTGCTMPYYANSTEEILFHVSTRMPSSAGADIEQKVRHLGNDEVHIIWSEHWRDYRRYIFKTQFADVLIVIYPLQNGLYRIQIDKKNNIQFGPLYDGAVVDALSLSSLVRATAINALRAQRTPLCMYRGRYQDRWRYIQSVMRMTVESSFEDFAQNVIHPLQASTLPNQQILSSVSRQSPIKSIPSILSASVLPSTGSLNSSPSLSKLPTISSSPETRWTLAVRGGSVRSSKSQESSEFIKQRPRSRTNELTVPNKEVGTGLHHQSVPDNLHNIGNIN